MAVEPPVCIYRSRIAFGTDVVAGARGENGERQRSVVALEAANVGPILKDRVHLAKPQQGVGHLVTVQRWIRVAVAETAAIRAYRPISREHLRVHGGEDVLRGGPGLGFAQEIVRQHHAAHAAADSGEKEGTSCEHGQGSII